MDFQFDLKGGNYFLEEDSRWWPSIGSDLFVGSGEELSQALVCIGTECYPFGEERYSQMPVTACAENDSVPSAGQEEAPVGQKKRRNNQNHVRTLNRKILKMKSRQTYKIHFLNQKRVTIALCRRAARRGELLQLQQHLEESFRSLGEDSKDAKLRKHLEFICALKSEDLQDDSRAQQILLDFGTVGQDKAHPIDSKKFSLSSLLETEEELIRQETH